VSIAQEAGSGNGTLVIIPTRPLQASHDITNIGYLVLLTNGIHDTSGTAAVADNDYRTVRDQAIAEITAGASTPTCTPITNATLNAICRLTFAHLRVGAAVGVSPSTVVMSFGFSTQSTGDTLDVIKQTIAASPLPVITAVALPGPSGALNTHDISASLQGKADVFAGTVRVPYYLSVATAACNAVGTLGQCPPIRASWTAAGASPAPGIDPASRNLTRFNPVPAKTTDLDIPLLVLVPNANSASLGVRPAGGWPVAIFQHGLTRNRFDAIAVADAFADAGFVVVSIDLPMHGITPTSTLAPFRIPGLELTFDLDVASNTTLAPGPDGVVDGSGQNFVNLASLLTTRDNLRQGAVDLLALTRALSSLELTGDTTPDINLGRIHFVGHSLGGIVGAVYATLGTNVRTASLLMSGGGVANTINDSPAFGPLIRAGLAAQSGGLLVPGTTLFNQFFRDAQTVTDSGDPINYFGSLVALKPVHVTQVIGQPPTWQPDLVVPNNSTQRLIASGGSLIRRVSAFGPNPVAAGNAGYVNFIFGHHGSIIDPSCSTPAVGPDPARCLATTVEMQRETVTFAALDGAAIVITDTSVVQP
jgi:pimeloyl-ACP methyl ester carboxylesterase